MTIDGDFSSHHVNFNFILKHISDASNRVLKERASCYVSLHRSEGYGLNLLEALAAGVPVIATNYSGNLEIFKPLKKFENTCIFPVAYKLVEIQQDCGAYTKGNRWAEPDKEAAVEAMRRVVSGSCGEERRKQLASTVHLHFSQQKIGEIMNRLISESSVRIHEKLDDVDLSFKQ